MKKKIFVALMAVAVGLGMLTGCSKDKPYSSYNIGTQFYGLPDVKDKNEASKLPADQRDLYFVAECLAGWLVDNGYIRTNNLGNPLVIEGADLTYNDQVAYDLYENEVKRLDEADLEKVITDAQKSNSDKLEITTSGTVSFSYALTRTTTLPEGTQVSKRYTVSYSPASANPSNPE